MFAGLGIGAVQAASVDITSGGSNGPIVVAVGATVTFDAAVICDDLLIAVPGSEGPKGGDPESEVEWQIRNDSPATIRLVAFGVDWVCLNDPGGDCGSWRFDYLKFDDPVNAAKKIYDAMSPAPTSFPVTPFDRNVGSGGAGNIYGNPWLDVAPGQVVDINEMEFVDAGGDKIDPMTAGTQVEFTVTWRDDAGIDYVQVLTVTW